MLNNDALLRVELIDMPSSVVVVWFSFVAAIIAFCRVERFPSVVTAPRSHKNHACRRLDRLSSPLYSCFVCTHVLTKKSHGILYIFISEN